MIPSRYHRSPRVLSRTYWDEAVLAAPEREGFELLEGTAADVWMLLGSPRGLSEITRILAEAYGARASVVRADVAALLRQLKRAGLIEEVKTVAETDA